MKSKKWSRETVGRRKNVLKEVVIASGQASLLSLFGNVAASTSNAADTNDGSTGPSSSTVVPNTVVSKASDYLIGSTDDDGNYKKSHCNI